jgi:hypothetical protein
MLISTNYNLVWEYSPAPHYQFTQTGKCFNVKTGKEIKRTLVGYTEGFCLNGKFKSLSYIRKNLTKIKTDIICPF